MEQILIGKNVKHLFEYILHTCVQFICVLTEFVLESTFFFADPRRNVRRLTKAAVCRRCVKQ